MAPSVEDMKKLYDEQEKLVKDIRAELDSKKAETAESKSKVEKMEARLQTMEAKAQEATIEYQKQKEAALAQKEVIDQLQAKLFRAPAGKDEKSAHYKAFEKFVKIGEKSLSVDELKYLRTDNSAQAGVLAPTEMLLEIIKNITEISPMRTVARVRPTTRSGIELPKRTSAMAGGWVGEGGLQTESESSYGENVILTKELSAYAIISHKQLNDSVFNMESEINQDLIETFAQLEGRAFVSGTGIKQPMGFLNNATLKAATTHSGVADNIDSDTILDVTGQLKTGYNPVWLLNRKTVSKIRQLKSGLGEYVWQGGLANVVPNTIAGFPYVLMPDMDDIGAGKFPMAFGDFKRGYTIVDGMQLIMIRDEYSLAKYGKVQFVGLKSVGGDVTLVEAIQLYECAA
jgi:HK97 family phage major capsid protein